MLLSLLAYVLLVSIPECGKETNNLARRASEDDSGHDDDSGNQVMKGEEGKDEGDAAAGEASRLGLVERDPFSKPSGENDNRQQQNIFYHRKGDPWLDASSKRAPSPLGPNPPPRYEEINCTINGEYTIVGRREGNSTFIPFSFLAKHFEVEGKLVVVADQQEGDNKRQRKHQEKEQEEQQQQQQQGDQRPKERLEWHHSSARIYDQKPYKADGMFMTFEHYHVEQRATVKHISGVEGRSTYGREGVQKVCGPIMKERRCKGHSMRSENKPFS